MEKTTCIILDENDKDRLELAEALNEFDFLDVVANTGNPKESLGLLNELEPQLLFLSIKETDLSSFALLEKVKKQPTIIFLTSDVERVKSFEANHLHYLKKPLKINDLQQLITSIHQTHRQIAQKMQGLLGKIKFEG